MSFQEKLKHKFPKQEEQKQKELNHDPTETMFMDKEQCWQYEQAVRDSLRELRQRCLDEALGVKS